MRVRTTWLLVAVLFMMVLAFQATPAKAQPPFPQGYSIIFVDAFGSIMECVDFRRCSGGTCPADAFFAGRRGACTPVEEFELGRTRTSCTWRNINWSFFAPNTREINLDVTCSRWGNPFFWAITPGPASCGAGVSYKRLLQYSANLYFNEGYTGVTIGAKRSCAAFFFGLDSSQLEGADIRSLISRRAK